MEEFVKWHIFLNRCCYYLAKHAKRHNIVSERIKEAITRYMKNYLKSEIHENKSITLTESETTSGAEYRNNMRPTYGIGLKSKE
jgi:hypothetical protein